MLAVVSLTVRGPAGALGATLITAVALPDEVTVSETTVIPGPKSARVTPWVRPRLAKLRKSAAFTTVPMLQRTNDESIVIVGGVGSEAICAVVLEIVAWVGAGIFAGVFVVPGVPVVEPNGVAVRVWLPGIPLGVHPDRIHYSYLPTRCQW